mmetsp:Transcript_53895/g.85423  ORF Transcript_53895/g.85423 Transcript_53895/m.85423 type:complete len:230 (-) Transcript_53895:166-855(-)
MHFISTLLLGMESKKLCSTICRPGPSSKSSSSTSSRIRSNSLSPLSALSGCIAFSPLTMTSKALQNTFDRAKLSILDLRHCICLSDPGMLLAGKDDALTLAAGLTFFKVAAHNSFARRVDTASPPLQYSLFRSSLPVLCPGSEEIDALRPRLSSDSEANSSSDSNAEPTRILPSSSKSDANITCMCEWAAPFAGAVCTCEASASLLSGLENVVIKLSGTISGRANNGTS